MLQNVFGLATSALKLGIDANRAGKQRARAAELINESKQIKKTPLRKEFEQSKRGADMMATQGLASTFTAQKQLDADAANNLKAIQQSSPSGAVASAAIASSLADKNKASQSLLARDAEFRTAGAKSALDKLWQVGEKERDLEIEKRERQEGLQRRAMALEDSALKRTEAAEGQFLKSATSSLTSAFSGGMGGMGGGMGSMLGGGGSPSGGGGVGSAGAVGSGGMPSGGGGSMMGGMDFGAMITGASQEDSALRQQDKAINAIGANLNSKLPNKQSTTPLQQPSASAFGALADADKIAFAKTKSLLSPQATDDDYIELLKRPDILKQLEEQYGK